MTDSVGDIKSFQDYIDILKRRKFSMLLPAIVIVALALMLAFGLPSAYQSKAMILIEEQEIPQDFVRTTISSFAAQQVQVISQRVLTVENITRIIEKFKLYQQGVSDSPIPSTELATKFRDNVLVDLVSADVIDPRSGRPTAATIAFSLSFTNTEAASAQAVTNELVTLFLNENLRERTRQVNSAEEFLKTEAEKLNKELLVLEQRRAEFKAAHEGNLPESYQFNLTTLERTRAEYSEVERRVQELEKRKLELAGRLAQLSPSAPVVLPSGETVLSSADRLKALQSEQRSKAAIYRDNHPDLIRLDREISTLQAELGISGKSGAPQADNPAYILLDTQLSTVTSEMRSLVSMQGELQTKMRHYEDLLKQAPDVERDYQALQRDYGNVSAKYEDIKRKQQEAAVYTNLERDQKGQRFTLIEPPSLPIAPVSPNRPAIVFLGFVLAVAAGLGFAMLRELMDGSVHGARHLAAIMGEAPLVVIQYIDNDDDILRQQYTRKISLTAALLAGVLFILYLHFFYKPLDVLYFVIINRLGLG
jgi:polysaccharide biosynthesis transport protein